MFEHFNFSSFNFGLVIGLFIMLPPYLRLHKYNEYFTFIALGWVLFLISLIALQATKNEYAYVPGYFSFMLFWFVLLRDNFKKKPRPVGRHTEKPGSE